MLSKQTDFTDSATTKLMCLLTRQLSVACALACIASFSKRQRATKVVQVECKKVTSTVKCVVVC